MSLHTGPFRQFDFRLSIFVSVRSAYSIHMSKTSLSAEKVLRVLCSHEHNQCWRREDAWSPTYYRDYVLQIECNEQAGSGCIRYY